LDGDPPYEIRDGHNPVGFGQRVSHEGPEERVCVGEGAVAAVAGHYYGRPPRPEGCEEAQGDGYVCVDDGGLLGHEVEVGRGQVGGSWVRWDMGAPFIVISENLPSL
jgi:hypothetical protein